jgi:hypothetical protein
VFWAFVYQTVALVSYLNYKLHAYLGSYFSVFLLRIAVYMTTVAVNTLLNGTVFLTYIFGKHACGSGFTDYKYCSYKQFQILNFKPSLHFDLTLYTI